MQPNKPLYHYQQIGLTFIEETGILALLNNSGLRQDEGRRQTDLDETSIAVGLTFEVIQKQIQQIRNEQVQDAQLQSSKAQTDWMLNASNDEWLQALQRLDISSQNHFDEWFTGERMRHET